MKTNNNEDDTIKNKGLELVLKCDAKAKEEIIRYVRENRMENVLVIGNSVLQSKKEIVEKSTSEFIKRKDRDYNCINCMQQKHGENGN